MRRSRNGIPCRVSRLTTSLTSGTLRPFFPWTITRSPWTSSRTAPERAFSNAGRQSPVQAEDDPFLRPQAADQGCRGVQRHDPAVVEDGHPVAQALGLFHEMGGQQDRLALRAHVAHQVPDGVPGLRVETGGQLVQEDQLRVRQERQGDEQALLLPAGQFREGGVAFLLQPQLGEQFLPVGRFGVERGVQVERLPDLHPVRQVGLLQLHPGAFAQDVALALRVHAQDADRPLVRFAQAFQAFDGGGLAGPVRADHPEDLAFLYLERDIIHGDGCAVDFAQSFNLHDGVHILPHFLFKIDSNAATCSWKTLRPAAVAET